MTKLIGGPAFACLVVLVVAATAFATASSGFRGEQADVAGTATVSAAVPAHGRACTQFQALERVFPAASAIGFTVRAVRRSGGHSIYWPGTCQKRYWFASYGRRVGGTYAVEVALTPFNTHDQALAALTEPAYGPVERLDNGAVVRRGSDSHRPGPAGRYHAAMVSVYRNVFISSSSMVFDHLVSLSAQERLHRRIHAGVLALNSAASPLPGRIAFNRHVAGDIHTDPVLDTFVVNADGSNERNLTQSRGGFDPVWSPDGRRLAFVRAGSVWTIDGAGRNERRLTPDLGADFPTWSPDGRRIVFQTWPGQGEKGRLAVVNANGSGLRMLAVAYPPSLWPNGRPAWSPNGKWIAFRRQNIVIVRADGRGERIVARCWGRCAVVRWSPDGESILFGDDRNAQIATVLVNVKSGRQRVLDPGSGGPLSPDGRLIAFGRDETIWIMSADGSNKHRLTKGSYPVVWSPDGAGLAFQRRSDRSDGIRGVSIFTIRINGTAERLVAEKVGDGYPSWGR